ncbi:hypothetical protein D1007_34349 [Hordeum vulgare]|nr:hypothetical protein D1007_34349 [Hordeum vulgare]
MDDDLNAAADLASLTSSSITTAPSRKGKPRGPCKTATTPKKKKDLTPEELDKESAKRKGQRNAADARDEAAAVVAIIIVTPREDTVARIAATTREVLLYLGLNPG